MSDRERPFQTVNEVLMGVAMLTVAAFHGYMLYLVARGSAKMDGFAPRVAPRAN